MSQKGFSWRFLFLGEFRRLLSDPTVLEKITINSGQKLHKSNFLKGLQIKQKQMMEGS
jgi:hypothetical protein